jgi:N-acetylmuramoyl-L-alanine amidase
VNAILKSNWELFMLALVVWREARNQPFAAQVGVACTVRNRVNAPVVWWGKTYLDVILCPDQYSSFNENDPNSTQFPKETDAVFPMCLAIARDVLGNVAADNTDGAQSYFDRSLDATPPTWASEAQHTVNIGDFRFFKFAPVSGEAVKA